MAKNRAQKKEFADSLHQKLEGASVVVIAHQTGLTVAQSTNLRQKMRAQGAAYKVTKNSLTRLALKGTKYEGLVDLFKGPTAIGYSADPIAAAKILVEFANENDKLTIVGGALGDKLLDANAVKALAKLPSLDELRGKIVGLLQAPAGKLARVTQAPAGQLARVIGAYARKGDA